MKITKKQLRGLIREEVARKRHLQLETVVRLINELHPGSNVGSYLKQAISKLWEADNLFQKALAEVPDGAAWKLVQELHRTMEQVTFAMDGKMQKVIGILGSGDPEGSERPTKQAQPEKKSGGLRSWLSGRKK